MGSEFVVAASSSHFVSCVCFRPHSASPHVPGEGQGAFVFAFVVTSNPSDTQVVCTAVMQMVSSVLLLDVKARSSCHMALNAFLPFRAV